MTNPPIPVGIVTIVQEADVNFVSLLNLRKLTSKKGPWSRERYKHKERMTIWRPTELHYFWRRMLGKEK